MATCPFVPRPQRDWAGKERFGCAPEAACSCPAEAVRYPPGAVNYEGLAIFGAGPVLGRRPVLRFGTVLSVAGRIGCCGAACTAVWWWVGPGAVLRLAQTFPRTACAGFVRLSLLGTLPSLPTMYRSGSAIRRSDHQHNGEVNTV